ncbi:MAG: YIP1 family protein [Candidatus Micrarchaeia archaeon]
MAFLISDLKKAINIMLHPGEATKETMNVKEALKFYYKVGLLPFLIFLIVGLMESIIIGWNYHVVAGVIFGSMVFIVFLSYLVIIPLGLLVQAGLFHLIIGKLFSMYKGSFNLPFTAYVYGTVPFLLVPLALVLIILFGFALALIIIIMIIMTVWSLIVSIIAMANQLGMSKTKAFAVMLLNGFIVSFISAIASSLLSLLAL